MSSIYDSDTPPKQLRHSSSMLTEVQGVLASMSNDSKMVIYEPDDPLTTKPCIKSSFCEERKPIKVYPVGWFVYHHSG